MGGLSYFMVFAPFPVDESLFALGASYTLLKHFRFLSAEGSPVDWLALAMAVGYAIFRCAWIHNRRVVHYRIHGQGGQPKAALLVEALLLPLRFGERHTRRVRGNVL